MNGKGPSQRATACLLVMCGLPASGKSLLSGMITAHFAKNAPELGRIDTENTLGACVATAFINEPVEQRRRTCEVVSFDDYEAGVGQTEPVQHFGFF